MKDNKPSTEGTAAVWSWGARSVTTNVRVCDTQFARHTIKGLANYYLYVGMAQTRPLAPYKSNGSELSNTVLSLFRQTTCSVSAPIHYNTLKVRKIYSYSDSRKIVKTPIVHLLLLLSSSVQTAYCETGVSNCSNTFTKIVYTGAYMILDA